MQVPAWQVSVGVHALPSLQVVPFAAIGFEHGPLVGLHVPATWHWSLAVHVTGFAPVQTPALAGVGLRARVPVVARRPVRRRRVRAGSRRSGCTSPPCGTGRSPCTSPGSPRCTSRSGTCRSACTRCRRCTSSRSRGPGSSTPPSLGCTSRRCGTGRSPCTSPGSAVQRPAWHVSVCVHALPSLHVVPFAAVGFEQAPSSGCTCPPTWHWSLAVHVTGSSPCTCPSGTRRSACRRSRRCTSSRSGLAGFEQAPLVGLHVPATWHWSLRRARHRVDPCSVPPGRCPSACTRCRRCTSSRSARSGSSRRRSTGSHVPATWHWSCAVHVTGFVPVHVPDWHASVCVHAFPSLQRRSVRRGRVRAAPLPGRRCPRRGTGPRRRSSRRSPCRCPHWQVSACVHALPSLHVVPSGLRVSRSRSPSAVHVFRHVARAVDARQTVGRGAGVDWQVSAVPLHVSATSHLPAAARQTVPLESAVQVPEVPARLQAPHVPVQAVLQQMPLEQNPDEHWLFEVHPRPKEAS